jgi:hypothetical protein
VPCCCLSGWSSEPYVACVMSPDHRAAAALLAISFRSVFESDLARATPPLALPVAVALYVAHYNLCRVHETLRTTPAVAIGIADHVWSIRELVDAALTAVPPKPTPTAPDRRRQFRVIQGGKS